MLDALRVDSLSIYSGDQTQVFYLLWLLTCSLIFFLQKATIFVNANYIIFNVKVQSFITA